VQNIFLNGIAFLIFLNGYMLAGNVTVTLVGKNPLSINIKGNTQNEEAGNISLYLYFSDDGETDLEENGIDVSQITGNASDQFGWPAFLEKKEIQGLGQSIEGGPWIRAGYTFTRRLLYDNADIGQQDDFWTISGIDAIVCTFTTLGSGHAFVEVAGSDGLANYNGISHNVSFETQEISLPITVPHSLEIPKEYKVYPNYPNPFNPVTTIRFDIPSTGTGITEARLIIYNSIGQTIKNLYQNNLGPGSYEVQWDGKTEFGKNASSGIYYLVFRTNEFSQTRKIVLLK
jgi:hypothetical protein